MNQIWQQGEQIQQIDVYDVDSKTMRFRVRNLQVRARILRRGMWNIAEIPLVVSKWSPLPEDEEIPEVKTIPLWVHFLTKFGSLSYAPSLYLD